ncbi:pirin family protein [Pedobacter sp. HMF7647]|uniref:Pirin family protein n=1 Tax=Hufsiella arboris TaxID=2695275 RepID=A0A7K1Y5R8_9SPHI|nr:pirin family protein [Hufsiella arboris]MXV49780.1 pirin family protein [Hufsiella arboris]
MKKIVHKAIERGIQDHGWLKAAHSFSFGGFFDPQKVHFGLLRVLNDDIVSPGMGFGTHGHDNMEIVTIPLKGTLAHKDSTGSEGNIVPGEVQIMSAGSGIRHSEFNASSTDDVNLLQIWVFPKERNITPRYDQKKYSADETYNKFKTVVSPDDQQGAMWINQDAHFSIGDFEPGQQTSYTIKFPGNGAYIFVIEGNISVDGTELGRRDAVGVYDAESFDIKISEKAKVLIIEIPME